MNRYLIRFGAFGVAAILLAGGAYSLTTHAEAQETKADDAAKKQAAAAPAGVKSLQDMIKVDATYATIDGQPLKGAEVKEFVQRLPAPLQQVPAQNANQLLEMIVHQMVNDRLVGKQAAADKLEENAEVKRRVSEAKEQIIRDYFVEKRLEGKITDAQVKKKYDEMVASMPTELEVRARHILVEDEKLANELIDKLKKGEKFEDLAKEHSKDPTKDNGGDLGYFVKSAMVPEFGDAVFSMKKGDISQKPVKTQFGWHVIKVEDSRPQQKPTFDQVKDRIRAQLGEEQIRSLVDELRGKSKVEVTIPKS